MKAIAVFPNKPNSVHLADLSKPSVEEIPEGRGVLVKVLRVGVDGTDKEINGTNDVTTDDTYFERGINLRHGLSAGWTGLVAKLLQQSGAGLGAR